MTSTKRIVLLFILLPVLGSIFSCLFFSARMRGTFTKWEMLNKPPATPAKLIRVDYFESVTDEIYELQYPANCTSGCWAKVDTLPPVLNEIDVLPLEDCKNAFDIPSVRRFTDSVIECQRWGTGILLQAQAIDHDGNIYQWHKGQDDFGDGLLLLMSPVIGVVFGFLATIGVLAVLVFADSVISLVSRR